MKAKTTTRKAAPAKSAPKPAPETAPKTAAAAKKSAPPKKEAGGLAGAKPLDARRFETDLLTFINTTLVPAGKSAVQAETPLFDDGLINSIKILDLIAFVEKSLGVRIPDKLMVMKHFRSPRAITTTFARS